MHIRPALALLTLSALLLTACGNQRPLVVVERDGDTALAEGNGQKAAEDFAEYNNRSPGIARVRHKEALANLAAGNAGAAVVNARLAFDLQPENAEYARTLADSLFAANEHDALDRFLRNEVQVRGRVSDYLLLGEYQMKMGDPDSAEPTLRTAAQVDRGQTLGPQLALADFYRAVGKQSDELLRLKMALFIDPYNPEIEGRIRSLGEVPGPMARVVPEERN